MANILEVRSKVLVNTDPQRRCYNGCHYSSELMWSQWEVLDSDVADDQVASQLEFWRDLNDYSVSVGGKKREYRIRRE